MADRKKRWSTRKKSKDKENVRDAGKKRAPPEPPSPQELARKQELKRRLRGRIHQLTQERTGAEERPSTNGRGIPPKPGAFTARRPKGNTPSFNRVPEPIFEVEEPSPTSPSSPTSSSDPQDQFVAVNTKDLAAMALHHFIETTIRRAPSSAASEDALPAASPPPILAPADSTTPQPQQGPGSPGSPHQGPHQWPPDAGNVAAGGSDPENIVEGQGTPIAEEEDDEDEEDEDEEDEDEEDEDEEDDDDDDDDYDDGDHNIECIDLVDNSGSEDEPAQQDPGGDYAEHRENMGDGNTAGQANGCQDVLYRRDFGREPRHSDPNPPKREGLQGNTPELIIPVENRGIDLNQLRPSVLKYAPPRGGNFMDVNAERPSLIGQDHFEPEELEVEVPDEIPREVPSNNIDHNSYSSEEQQQELPIDDPIGEMITYAYTRIVADLHRSNHVAQQSLVMRIEGQLGCVTFMVVKIGDDYRLLWDYTPTLSAMYTGPATTSRGVETSASQAAYASPPTWSITDPGAYVNLYYHHSSPYPPGFAVQVLRTSVGVQCPTPILPTNLMMQDQERDYLWVPPRASNTVRLQDRATNITSIPYHAPRGQPMDTDSGVILEAFNDMTPNQRVTNPMIRGQSQVPPRANTPPRQQSRLVNVDNISSHPPRGLDTDSDNIGVIREAPRDEAANGPAANPMVPCRSRIIRCANSIVRQPNRLAPSGDIPSHTPRGQPMDTDSGVIFEATNEVAPNQGVTNLMIRGQPPVLSRNNTPPREEGRPVNVGNASSYPPHGLDTDSDDIGVMWEAPRDEAANGSAANPMVPCRSRIVRCANSIVRQPNRLAPSGDIPTHTPRGQPLDTVRGVVVKAPKDEGAIEGGNNLITQSRAQVPSRTNTPPRQEGRPVDVGDASSHPPHGLDTDSDDIRVIWEAPRDVATNGNSANPVVPRVARIIRCAYCNARQQNRLASSGDIPTHASTSQPMDTDDDVVILEAPYDVAANEGVDCPRMRGRPRGNMRVPPQANIPPPQQDRPAPSGNFPSNSSRGQDMDTGDDEVIWEHDLGANEEVASNAMAGDASPRSPTPTPMYCGSDAPPSVQQMSDNAVRGQDSDTDWSDDSQNIPSLREVRGQGSQNNPDTDSDSHESESDDTEFSEDRDNSLGTPPPSFRARGTSHVCPLNLRMNARSRVLRRPSMWSRGRGANYDRQFSDDSDGMATNRYSSSGGSTSASSDDDCCLWGSDDDMEASPSGSLFWQARSPRFHYRVID